MACLARRIAPAAALGGLAVVIVGVADPAIANLTSGDAPSESMPQALTGTGNLDTGAGARQNGQGGQGNGQQRSEPEWQDIPQDEQQAVPPQEQAPPEEPQVEATGEVCATGEQVNGDPIMTPWGPVTVAASVDGGTVCFVQAIDWPQDDRKSQMINSYAIPELDTMASQVGTQFDYISGATYTSEAYRDSLQSLLDRL